MGIDITQAIALVMVAYILGGGTGAFWIKTKYEEKIESLYDLVATAKKAEQEARERYFNGLGGKDGSS